MAEVIILNILNNLNRNLFSFSYSLSTKKDSNILTEAIKCYSDEYLTGLTEEERKAIEKEIKAYLDSIPKGQKVDREALSDM